MIVFKIAFCMVVCTPLAYLIRFLIKKLVDEANK